MNGGAGVEPMTQKEELLQKELASAVAEVERLRAALKRVLPVAFECNGDDWDVDSYVDGGVSESRSATHEVDA